MDLTLRVPGQHPDTDLGISVDKTDAHRISVKIMDIHQIAVFKTAHHRIDLIIKHPKPAAFNGSSFTLF